ncbi:MAG: hypothetical protein H6739_19525 [Alphaproteobacteria bacterium]|nr:hypothetical protein [Alphaproteobacteria bacterium]
MTLRHLILSTTVGSLGALTACGYCPPSDPESFWLHDDVTEADVQAIIEEYNQARFAIDCDTVCEYKYFQDPGNGDWMSPHAETCTLELDPEPAEQPEDIVGDVTCEGEAYDGERTEMCEGRRPLGHVEPPSDDASLDAVLARCAHLEAASVVAFRQLARQLHGWGAPVALIERCLQAAAEEAEHARVMAALTKAHIPHTDPTPTEETLFAVALHNAVEGCVNECWAAMLAFLKSRMARTPALRAAYARLVDDETRHGELAWDVHRWLMGQLNETDQQRITEAQRAAIARLPAVARVQAEWLPQAMGLPAPAAAAAMARRFGAGLLAA